MNIQVFLRFLAGSILFIVCMYARNNLVLPAIFDKPKDKIVMMRFLLAIAYTSIVYALLTLVLPALFR